MRRDTVSVNGNSYVILRFTADSPGVWLFHCHIEWHVSMGLVATVIEAPAMLQRAITIPQQHLDICIAQCVPTAGNAAGNTVNHTDLAGANTASPNPDNGALVNISACSNSASIATPSAVSSPECSHPAVSHTYRAGTTSIATESSRGGFSVYQVTESESESTLAHVAPPTVSSSIHTSTVHIKSIHTRTHQHGDLDRVSTTVTTKYSIVCPDSEPTSIPANAAHLSE